MSEPAQGELLPTGVTGPNGALEQLNHAKAMAWERAAFAVEFLGEIMRDEDNDLEHRILAAGEILNFVKAPF